MIDRKEIEKLMKEYAEERGLGTLSISFHQAKSDHDAFFSVYDGSEKVVFDEIESKKEKTKYHFTVKIVDDENLEEPHVYIIDTTHELYTEALKDFKKFDISGRWMMNYFRDMETYKTKSVEKSIARIVEGHSFKLIAFASYGVREYEAKLH